MRKKTKIILVLLLFIPLFSFAFAPRAAASHGELNSFIRIPSFGVNFPSNWHSAPWQTMIDSWDPATSHLIMYWWCEPFDDEWVWVGPGPDDWMYDWESDKPLYNDDEGLTIAFGIAVYVDEEFNPLTQQSAKYYRDNIEISAIIDIGLSTEYEVDLRISPVVKIPKADNPIIEGGPVYFFRVGAVFKPGELRGIIGAGEHTILFIINDIFEDWNSDYEIWLWKNVFEILNPLAPNTCKFDLS